MPRIKLNDITLNYETHGKGEPLFFVSGFNTDRTIWNNLIEEYAAHYQVIVLDNRGAGESDAPDYPYTIEMMAEDVVELCERLALNPCHFIGSSMGGAIVQTLAFKYPERIRNAVLYNTFTQIDVRFALFAQGRLELFKAGISSLSLSKLGLGWVFTSAFLNQPGRVESILDIVAASSPPTTEIGYRNQLSALLNFNSEGWIKKIKVPCLVIGSDQDMIVSEAHSQHLAAQIPNALYHGFKGVGHIAHLEQAEAFNVVVQKFLRV